MAGKVWSIQDQDDNEIGQIILYAGELKFTGDVEDFADYRVMGKSGRIVDGHTDPEEWFEAADQLGNPYVRFVRLS